MQRVNEGLSEEDAWRLFQQIVEALVHMSTLGIVCLFLPEMRFRYSRRISKLHRDIKLTNIFIDGKGDCKGTVPLARVGAALTVRSGRFWVGNIQYCCHRPF
jgi:serine/threonine protein kinase